MLSFKNGCYISSGVQQFRIFRQTYWIWFFYFGVSFFQTLDPKVILEMQVFDFMSKDRENALDCYVPCYYAYVFVFQLDDISGVVFATTIGYYDFYPKMGQSKNMKRCFCFISAKMAKHEIFWRKFEICLTRSQNDVFEYRVTMNCCLV